METLYENIKHDDLNMPATVSFSSENAEKIVELMKEAEVKCIVQSDKNKTDITFGINDIEKLNKILQPIGIERQLNNSAIQLHNIEKKENLIPIANAFSNLFERKINGKNSRMESHKKHIAVLSKSLNKRIVKADTLKDRELMLRKIAMTFPFFKSPINALIKRNEKKIERLNNQIPKLEKQIRIHQTTIDKLNKSAENYKVRKNACKHLSEVIKSFVIVNKKERNQSYLTALLSLNGDIQQLNNDRIKNCIDTIGKLETNFSELPLIKQQKAQERISNLIRTQNKLAERNKILQAAQPDISAMLAKLNENKVTEGIDKAEIMLDKTIAQNNSISLDSVMSFASVENSCAVSPTAAEIVQTEVNVISNINDKDRDMIPDKIDSTFDPKSAENENSQAVKEHPHPVSEIQNDAMLNEYKAYQRQQAYEEVISALTSNNFFKNADEIPDDAIMKIWDYADKKIERNPFHISNSLNSMCKSVMPIISNNISSFDQIQTALNFISLINNNMQQIMNTNIGTVNEMMSELSNANISLDDLQAINHFSGEVIEINDNIKQITNNNGTALDKIQNSLNNYFDLGNNTQYANELAQMQDKLSSVSAENNSLQQKINDVDKAMHHVFDTYKIVEKQKKENTLFYHLSSEEFNTLRKSGIKYEGDERYKITDEIDYGKFMICIDVKYKNKFEEILPNIKPENTQAQERINSEIQAVQEQQNPVSAIQEKQNENTQTQEIPSEYDDSFDEMLEKYKDQIPPLYDDYMPDPPPENNVSEAAPNVPFEHNDKKSDTRKYLVTEKELESLRKSGLNMKVNRKQIQEDGRISILINVKDKGKYEKIMDDLKKSNKNKAVRK